MPFFPHLVILFTRYPQPGQCKSRLIPTLGKEGAMKVHTTLTLRTLQQIKSHLHSHNAKLHIYYDGGSLQTMKEWLGAELDYSRQQGNTIGERMSRAFIENLGQEQNIILTGSDCPSISASLLADAASSLADHDMVIGPAYDGGYYLLGLSSRTAPSTCQQLFDTIPWSTDRVLKQTIQRAEEQRLTTHILPTLHDIDIPDDLRYFHHHSHPQ